MKQETETEQLILEAAEEEFLEKGYNGAKTTSIARSAGVTHAMLHYYYRTKEHLFDMVFRNKVQLISSSLGSIFDEDMTFEEGIRKFVHAHFTFIKQNPRLVHFVYNEIYSNKVNRDILYHSVYPKVSVVFEKIAAFIKKEEEKGTIRTIDPLQFILNILSLNVMTFVVYPLIKEYATSGNDDEYERLLKEREESNITFILQSVKK